MANKQINQLTEKSSVLRDDDLLVVYDSEETGSEKTKKVTVKHHIVPIVDNLTLYVSPTGNDTTGDGSSGNPWATPNQALSWLTNKFISSDAIVTIQLADGIYNGLGTIYYSNYSNKIALKGNETSPSNVVLNFNNNIHGIMLPAQGYLYMSGLKIVGYSNTGGAYNGIYTRYNASVQLYKCIIDTWKTGINNVFGGHCLLNASTLNNNDIGLACQAGRSELIGSCTVSNNVTYGLSSVWASEIVSSGSNFSNNGTDKYTASNGRITTA